MNTMLLLAVFLPMAGGVASYLTGRKNKRARDAVVCLFAAIETAIGLMFLLAVSGAAAFLSSGSDGFAVSLGGVCGMGLSFRLDGFRALYVLIASVMWLCASIFSREYMEEERNRNRYYLFWLVTFGAVAGVLLSADFFTTFVFFEIMSFTSFVWVIHEEKPEGIHAGNLYLAIAVISGLVMLMGLMMLYTEVGTLTMSELAQAVEARRVAEAAVGAGAAFANRLFVIGCLILVGFGAKAGLFLLHVWLPKAHTVAPAPASALLSGVLTKMGIFGILAMTGTLFFGNVRWGVLLLVLGLLTMFTGAFLALFSVNFKRTLACSSVSQMGFILVGLAMSALLTENSLALDGALLHMVNHSMIKLVLFLIAGVIVSKTGSLHLNTIRGYGRNKPLLHAAFLVGGMSIAGIPLGSGYISKTLLHESLVEYMEELAGSGGYAAMKAAEVLFLLTGGMTLAYMLKLEVAVFVERGDAENEPCCKTSSLLVILLPALFLLVCGILPHWCMDRIAAFGTLTEASARGAGHASVAYFSLESLKGAAISIGIGVVLYFGVVRTALMKKTARGKVYVDRLPAWMDLEKNVYQPIVLQFLPFVFGLASRVCDRLVDGFVRLLHRSVFCPKRLHRPTAVGSGFTYLLGSCLDAVVLLLNRTVRKKDPIRRSFVDSLAIQRAELRATGMVVAKSVSFGLLMFAAGFLLTLLYLLIRD